jgi:hypothetical protein
MALTLNNFWGAEGTSSEYKSTSASVGYSSVIPDAGGGRYSYELFGTDHVEFDPFASISDAGTKCILGFAFYTSSLSPSDQIARLWDGTNTDFDIYFDGTTDEIHLRNSAGTEVISTGSSSISSGTWYRVEVYVDRVNSGSAELFLNGVSQGTTSAQDFSAITGTPELRFDAAGTGGQYYDHIYFGTGATSSADRLGNSLGEVGVVAYWSSLASATPDTGTALDTGQWADIQLFERTSAFGTTILASYTASTVGGSVNTDDLGGSANTGGPNTDADVEADPIGIKGIWQLSRGGGGGTTHYGLLGNNTDGTTQFTFALNQGTGETFEAVSESATIVPTASEYCKIGFETSGAQDIECYGMVAQVLHVPKNIFAITTSNVPALAFTDFDTAINDKTQVTQQNVEALALTKFDTAVQIRNDVVVQNVPVLTLTSFNSSTTDVINIVVQNVEALTLTDFDTAINDKTQITQQNVEALTLTDFDTAINDKTQVTATTDGLTLTEVATAINDKTQVTQQNVEALTLIDFDTTVNDKTQVTQQNVPSLTFTSFNSSTTDVINIIVPNVPTLTLTLFPSAVTPVTIKSNSVSLNFTTFDSVARLEFDGIFEIPQGQINFGGSWTITKV